MPGTTAITVNLTAAMTSAYAGKDVYLAVYSSPIENGTVVQNALQQITFTPGHTASATFNATDGSFWSGNVFVVVADHGSPVSTWLPPHGTTGDVQTGMQDHGLIFQMYELTLSGSATDQGDISAVNTFGLSSSMSARYSDGTSDSRGFSATTNTLRSDIINLNHDAQVSTPPGSQTHIDMVAGPATGYGADQYYWDQFVFKSELTYLSQHPDELAQMQLMTNYNSTFSQYTLHYQAGGTEGGYFWFVPNTANGTFDTHFYRVSFDQLVTEIYGQSGTIDVFANGMFLPPTTPSAFSENLIGNLTRQLVAGFDAGFWGATADSTNPLGGKLDFNKPYNWQLNYAYDAALTSLSDLNVHFTSSIPNAIYDTYAREILLKSNAYGYSYGDFLSVGGTNPQLSLGDPAGGNVSAVEITVFGPDETPTGYKAPTFDYVAGPYTAPDTNLPGADTLVLALNIGDALSGDKNHNLVPANDVPLHLIFYGMQGTTVTPVKTIDLNPSTGQNPWNVITFSGGAAYSETINSTNTPGTITIAGFPVNSSGIGFCQLVMGSGAQQVTYDIYYDASKPIDQRFTVDHGVTVQYTASTTVSGEGSTKFIFAPSGSPLFDPDLLSPSTLGDGHGVVTSGHNADDFINGVVNTGGGPTATNNADVISGGGGNDVICGLGGDDILSGGAGTGIDMLFGNDGNDIFYAPSNGSAFDFFDGGSGTDTIRLGSPTETGLLGVRLAGLDTTFSSIERVVADPRSDGAYIVGTNAANLFDLGALTADPNAPGNKHFFGLFGGGGDDVLRGSPFADRLFGQDGNDILDGRAGNDTLIGGTGNDTFVFGPNYGADTVKDFMQGQDRIDVSGYTSIHDVSQIQVIDRGGAEMLAFGNGQVLLLLNYTGTLTNADFIFAG